MPLKFKSLDLFTGVGGIAHALRDLGITPAAYCEIEPTAIAVLRQRMRCGDLPSAPIHTDVSKFPGKQFRGKIQVIAGGFPCFPAGTPVLTDQGYMPIENVTGTEKLLTHTGSWKNIENLQRKLFDGRMATVSLKHQKITCTDNHPFYARTLENSTPDWIAAKDLTAKHLVGHPITEATPETGLAHIHDAQYAWYTVTDVSFEHTSTPTWVYNFQVEDDHSYIVQNIAVHNCTGFSTMGQLEHFDDPGSGLYKHVIRLVTEIQPQIVFLENVAAIRLSGLRHVAETLRARGYNASWVTLRGFNVGAPQHRPRWFCLATKTDFSGTLALEKPFVPFKWPKREPYPRMTLNKELCGERAALLGNSVIPEVVRFAFLYLFTGSCWPAPKVFAAKQWDFALPDPESAKTTKEPPSCGLTTGRNQVKELPAPQGLMELPAYRKIVLDPTAFKYDGPRHTNNTLERLEEPTTLSCFGTPRHGNTAPSRVLTSRCARDLPTQIRFAVDTPNHLRKGVPNPNFIEWLMGFDCNWTHPFEHVKKAK
jgi:site-specific DNA-cytosine methylase